MSNTEQELKNALAAFDNMATTAETLKHHLFRLMDIIEAQIVDPNSTVHPDELEDYIKAARFAKRFGRYSDRINEAEEIIEKQ